MIILPNLYGNVGENRNKDQVGLTSFSPNTYIEGSHIPLMIKPPDQELFPMTSVHHKGDIYYILIMVHDSWRFNDMYISNVFDTPLSLVAFWFQVPFGYD